MKNYSFLSALTVGSALSVLALGAPLAAQSTGELFPQPFLVEHHVVHLEDDGTRYVSEPVIDTYGGSWLVSQRADGSRLVLDLARREITEVRPEHGTYWRLSFTRLAELQSRIERLDEMPSPDGLDPASGSVSEKTPTSEEPGAGRLRVRELSAAPAKSLAGAPQSLDARPGIQRFRVEEVRAKSADEAAASAFEIWVDPAFRLTAQAREALTSFERDALRGDQRLAGVISPLDVMKAVREQTAGAFPVRTRQPIPGGIVEDITTRLERIERFDLDLVRVPEGLERVPHPLENVVGFMEKEAERRELMGSLPE